MRLLGRLFGNKRPTLPAGAIAFIWNDDNVGTSWSIRYRIPPQEEGPDCPHVPGAWRFTDQAKAFAEAEWVNGGERPAMPGGKV